MDEFSAPKGPWKVVLRIGGTNGFIQRRVVPQLLPSIDVPVSKPLSVFLNDGRLGDGNKVVPHTNLTFYLDERSVNRLYRTAIYNLED